jgi:hypothetical protein
MEAANAAEAAAVAATATAAAAAQAAGAALTAALEAPSTAEAERVWCHDCRATSSMAAALLAGAYTRPLLSSTSAISDTKAHHKHPIIPCDTW